MNREFFDALIALHKGKCPGLDGLFPSFFIALWDRIGDDVTSALQGVWDSVVMPNSLLEGLIHLIPKGGCMNFISQWRPITLLDTCYNIMDKESI